MGDTPVPAPYAPPPRILIVDDDDAFRTALVENLRLTGRYEVLDAADADTAVTIVQRDRDISCIVLDYDFPARAGTPQPSGLALMERFKTLAPHAPIIMISGITEQRGRVAIDSIRNHAVAFLDKPFPAHTLIEMVDALFQRADDHGAAQATFAAAGFATRDPLMAAICAEALVAARADWNLLLVGETGTGKDRLARAIHAVGLRAQAPFVELNCATLSRELFTSELFGHRRGAFTGSVEDKPGLFEKAAGGTIFLNEITEMPFEAQAGFNHAVEERRYRRVGDTEERPVAARIVGATNRNLTDAIREQRLREDLKYRFDQVIELPPLRRRPGDIPLIVDRFVEHFGGNMLHRPLTLSRDAMALLQRQPWAGNVRQLLSIVKRAAVHSRDDVVTAAAVGEQLRLEYGLDDAADLARVAAPALDGTLDETIEGIRRRFIDRTLRETRGNMTEAAHRLGYATKEGLKRWLEKFGIDPRSYR